MCEYSGATVQDAVPIRLSIEVLRERHAIRQEEPCEHHTHLLVREVLRDAGMRTCTEHT